MICKLTKKNSTFAFRKSSKQNDTMKKGLKDLIKLVIVIVVLCAFVYLYPEENPEIKKQMYFGVVGGGVAAFLAFFFIKMIREKTNKKK